MSPGSSGAGGYRAYRAEALPTLDRDHQVETTIAAHHDRWTAIAICEIGRRAEPAD